MTNTDEFVSHMIPHDLTGNFFDISGFFSVFSLKVALYA